MPYSQIMMKLLSNATLNRTVKLLFDRTAAFIQSQPTLIKISAVTVLSLAALFVSANVVMAAATIFLGLLNYQLVVQNRPILVADRPSPMYFSPEDVQEALRQGKHVMAASSCPIRNVGKSPAVILKISGIMKLELDLPLPATFHDCVETPLFKDKVVPPSEVSTFFVGYTEPNISPADWKRINDGHLKVIVYGQVIYEGMLWGNYTLNFGFTYEPSKSGFVQGNVFLFGPEEYNRII